MTAETYQFHGPMHITSDGKIRAIVNAADIVKDNGLWRMFPIINVDRVKDIPGDYPGPMGVPITIVDKMSELAWLKITGQASPRVNGKFKYRRFIVRNLHPAIPEKVDIADWLTHMEFQITYTEFHNGYVYITFADGTKAVTLKHKIEGVNDL